MGKIVKSVLSGKILILLSIKEKIDFKGLFILLQTSVSVNFENLPSWRPEFGWIKTEEYSASRVVTYLRREVKAEKKTKGKQLLSS